MYSQQNSVVDILLKANKVTYTKNNPKLAKLHNKPYFHYKKCKIAKTNGFMRRRKMHVFRAKYFPQSCNILHERCPQHLESLYRDRWR
jgi:hypothetical protein